MTLFLFFLHILILIHYAYSYLQCPLKLHHVRYELAVSVPIQQTKGREVSIKRQMRSQTKDNLSLVDVVDQIICKPL